ncbi:MAG: hypothetical protein Fur0042_31010 [Cyanophyceae cyanobacterium]
MTNDLFQGSVSYKVFCPAYEPSINGEELKIDQEDPEHDPDRKIKKSLLKVQFLAGQGIEFVLKLETHFLEFDLTSAKEWFFDYQEWIFSQFVLRTGAILKSHQSVTVLSLQNISSGFSVHSCGLVCGADVQVWSRHPLSQKLGDLSFLNSSQFAPAEDRKKTLYTLYKEYKFCLQCEDPIARYMLLYNLLFQVNRYNKRGESQGEVDKLIKKVIQDASDRGESIKNQIIQRQVVQLM